MQRGRWVAFVTLRVLALLAQTAVPAYGFTADARRLGMGGVVVPGCQELLALNVAYHRVPARPGANGFVLPVPLGLVQLANDFPTLDPQDENFSVTRLANLALNPPFFLELGKSSDLDGDISLQVARNEFSILLEDAQALLPQKPIEVGGVWSVPLAGITAGNVRTFLSPLLYLEGEVAFDDAFHAVLAQGVPLQPNSTYFLDAAGQSLGGASISFGWTAPIATDVRGNGLYAGAVAKYLLGFGMSHSTSRFALSTGDTIFGAQNSLEADYNASVRYAELGAVGNGYGLDLGVGYRTGPVDLGLGVRDLGARVHWGSTLVWQSFLDEATGAVQSAIVGRDEPFTQKLPMQGTANISWSGGKTMLAADIVTSRLGTMAHVGVERRAGPLALRSGVQTDQEARVQLAGGIGIGSSRFMVDLALQTHNRNLTGERGLLRGTSLALR